MPASSQTSTKSASMLEWEEKELGSILEALIDYRGKTPKKSKAGIPLVTAKVIKNGRILPPNEFLTTDEYDRWMTRGFPKKGDMVLTMEAPLGEVAIIEELPIALAQRTVAMRANDGHSTRFLKYFLQSRFGQHELKIRASGTTVQGIKSSLLKKVPIPSPPKNEQEAIAEVLSSLDDKIDLLNRQNKTLEGMAEALFRQWFIEEAQDDWGEFSASDFVEHIKESEKPQSKPDTWFSHFSLPAFDDGKKPLKEKGETIKSNKYVVQANSLLVSKLNPGTPRIWHCGPTLPQNPICSTEFQVVKPQPHLLGFFRCLYSSKEVVEFLSACASGTSGSHQRVKPKDIIELEFQAPSKDSMMEFSSLTADWFEKILENQAQIFTLENERNTLLPKLMSGEVRIQDTRINE